MLGLGIASPFGFADGTPVSSLELGYPTPFVRASDVLWCAPSLVSTYSASYFFGLIAFGAEVLTEDSPLAGGSWYSRWRPGTVIPRGVGLTRGFGWFVS